MFGASTINFFLSSEIGNPSLGTEENIDVISSANDLKNWLQSVSAQNPIILFFIPFIRVADIENFPVHFPQSSLLYFVVLAEIRRFSGFHVFMDNLASSYEDLPFENKNEMAYSFF